MSSQDISISQDFENCRDDRIRFQQLLFSGHDKIEIRLGQRTKVDVLTK